MSISLFKIWSFNSEEIDSSILKFENAGYTINTVSENKYVRFISMLIGYKFDFFSNITNQIISDRKFLVNLEQGVIDNLEHIDLLVNALYKSNNDDMARIDKEQKRNSQEYDEIINRTLLEKTRDKEPEDICPMNPHDESNFYFTDPITKQREVLKANHLFHYKNRCYDIDSVFRYINVGGHVPLSEDYIRRFFKANGSIDLSNMSYTYGDLRNNVYHENVRVLHLDNNAIDNLNGTNLPKTLEILSVDNNPIGGNYFLIEETPILKILSMKNCNLTVLDCQHLPQSLQILDVSNNHELTSLHSLSNMRNLRKLDIRGTNITKLDWSKFKTIDATKKLTIFCDPSVEFKKTKPEWIVVMNQS